MQYFLRDRCLLPLATLFFTLFGCQSVTPTESQTDGHLFAWAEGEANDADDDFDDHLTRESKRGGGLLFGDSVASQPINMPLRGELSSNFGRRRRRLHRGIDIRAKVGSSVRAAAPGVVEFAGWQHGYGRTIILRHDHYKTLYAHLSRIRVAIGDKINRLAEIGRSGHSGRATGPHLHFEVRTLEGNAIDPLSVITKDQLLSRE